MVPNRRSNSNKIKKTPRGGAHGKVVPVEEELAEQFEALAACDVVLRVQQALVVGEDLVVVGLEEFGAQDLVLGEQLLRTGVRSIS